MAEEVFIKKSEPVKQKEQNKKEQMGIAPLWKKAQTPLRYSSFFLMVGGIELGDLPILT